MEWEKAKTILIVLLILLNAGLFVMSFIGENKNLMAAEDVSAITEVLRENGISIECELPLESAPVKFMNISAAEWDYDYIKNVFFPNDTVTRTIESGNIIYRSSSGTRSVTVSGAEGNARELVYIEESAGSAEPSEYIRLMGSSFEGFELNRQTESELGKTYLYNDKTDDRTVFASSAEVSFLSGGVSVRAKKYDFVSYDMGVYEIFRADEALLTFLHYKNENFDTPVSIEAVQLGYGAVSNERTLKAKPYYRIFISGENEPVYIDAVMNTVWEW